MTQINKYFIIIINFIKFVAELSVDVVRFVISQIRNKDNPNKVQCESLARREEQINTNKPKPFYQERNNYGFPCGCSKKKAKQPSREL